MPTTGNMPLKLTDLHNGQGWVICGMYTVLFMRSGVESINYKCKKLKRRIFKEENAYIVAAVCGTEFLQFLAMLAILHPEDMKNTMNSLFSTYSIILEQAIL